MKLTQLILSIFFTTCYALAAHAGEVVYYPQEKGRDIENSFEFKILKTALEKSGSNFVLKPSKSNMNEARSKKFLANGSIHVAWYGTNSEIEKKLKPVRIPIGAGLTGYRLFLIHKDKQPEFNKVKNLEDLKKFKAAQGNGWSDIAILEHSKLKVLSKEYKNIFKVLNAGRVDYFPRGAAEVFHEMGLFGKDNPNMTAEENLMMYYQFAKLFFVNPDNQKLHDAIYQGLNKMHEDGTYWKMFNNEPSIKDTLAKAKLSSRVRINIPNPFLSKETAGIDKKYWYTPK